MSATDNSLVCWIIAGVTIVATALYLQKTSSSGENLGFTEEEFSIQENIRCVKPVNKNVFQR
jgi:hypothetical protein